MYTSIQTFLDSSSAWFAVLKDAATLSKPLPDLQAQARTTQDSNGRETTLETKRLFITLNYFLEVMSKFANARGITDSDIKIFDTLRANTTSLDKMGAAPYPLKHSEQYLSALESVREIVKLVDAIEARKAPKFAQTRDLTKILLDCMVKLVSPDEGEPEDIEVGEISKMLIRISYAFQNESKGIQRYGNAIQERFVGAYKAYDLLCDPALAADFEHTHKELLAARKAEGMENGLSDMDEAEGMGNEFSEMAWEDDVAMGNIIPEPVAPHHPSYDSPSLGPSRASSFSRVSKSSAVTVSSYGPRRRRIRASVTSKRGEVGRSSILFTR